MGESRKVKWILDYMGEEKVAEVDQYVDDLIRRDYVTFTSDEQIADFFLEYMNDFYQNTKKEEKQDIRAYSGILFREVNSVLRNRWNYEENGELTDIKKEEVDAVTATIEKVIERQNALSDNIKVYRGVDASIFQECGITSLEELSSLKGKYYYDSGFTSASFIRERSFFDRPLEFHNTCNVEIEYLIPKEESDILPLITSDLSYSPVQTECLIARGNLSKIVEVSVDSEQNRAYLKAALVPKKVWDETLERNSMVEKRSNVL